MKPFPPKVLSEYPPNTGFILYKQRRDGGIVDWNFHASGERDNEKTLREHLKRHFPNAEFI